MEIDITAKAKGVWNNEVSSGNKYTIPVDHENILRAKNGMWNIQVTDKKTVPSHWLPASLEGLRVLAVASGGGQQGPILAAAGAHVTVLDNSPAQLNLDKQIAKGEGLTIDIVEGDMTKLQAYFLKDHFDVVINPVSTMYISDVKPFFQGVSSVIKPNGIFVFGAMNPSYFLFDHYKMKHGIFNIRYKIPYDPFEQLNKTELNYMRRMDCQIAFGHSFEQLMGGICESGFHITNYYEDTIGGLIDSYFSASFAVRAIRNEY